MGTLIAPSKNQKNQIGGAGIVGVGTVQSTGVGTGGVALNLTAWQGREIAIHVSGEARIRWSVASSPTTISTANATSAAAPEATGGGRVYSGTPNYRDVPSIDAAASGEGVFLIIAAVSGTVDVNIEIVG